METFRIAIPDADLDDLRGRLAATRWPDEGHSPGWERGVPQEYLRDLADYWQHEYDWRAAEAELNRFPQYTTEIDGARVHFLHVRSPEPGAMPLLITHGWPGSFVEFSQIIEPLTNPRAHGGRPSDAYHLVIPTIPGFGFSGPVRAPGWSIPRVAGAWAQLMARLGYQRYATHSGDLGAWINHVLAAIDAETVFGSL